MALKERIQEDMKAAMRAGEKERLATIRMLLAGAISILLIVTRRLRRRDVIAYGPYLCLGALLTLLLQG